MKTSDIGRVIGCVFAPVRLPILHRLTGSSGLMHFTWFSSRFVVKSTPLILTGWQIPRYDLPSWHSAFFHFSLDAVSAGDWHSMRLRLDLLLPLVSGKILTRRDCHRAHAAHSHANTDNRRDTSVRPWRNVVQTTIYAYRLTRWTNKSYFTPNYASVNGPNVDLRNLGNSNLPFFDRLLPLLMKQMWTSFLSKGPPSADDCQMRKVTSGGTIRTRDLHVQTPLPNSLDDCRYNHNYFWRQSKNSSHGKSRSVSILTSSSRTFWPILLKHHFT